MNKLREVLRSWLGVESPHDWSVNIDELWGKASDKLDETNELMKKFSEVECSNCHKLVVTYPMGGGYHRLFDGTVLCGDCGAKHSAGKLITAPTDKGRD